MINFWHRTAISWTLATLLTAGIGRIGQAQVQRAPGNPFQPPVASMHYTRSRDYHVRHLKLVFDIDGPHRSAKGVVTHYLAALNDGLASIVMDAGANLQIEHCRIDGVDRPFVHKEDSLTITPAAPLMRGKEIAVEIAYVMPKEVRSGGANGLGGFHWVEPRANDPERKIEFWTQGETGGNHSWVPCYDYPNDKCTSDTTVTVPQAWEVIGNGSQGPTTQDTVHHTRTFRWTMTQPHSTYLLSLVGGELDVRKSSWAGVPLYYVVPKGKADLIPGSFGNTPDMLQFFSDTVGVKYAWPKYAQDAMFDFGGGMENVSATTLGAFSLVDMRSGDYPMSSLNSHELAHQWFGDLVTCANWGDVWLNESFATFFEMLYTEHHLGKDAYDQERDGNIRSYLGEARRYKRPVSTFMYANPDVMFDSHTYPKGGVILHMLRRKLGDAVFYRGLGHYLRVNEYKPVDAHDLEKALMEETGQSVEQFFDQWLFKPGHPVLDATWTYDDAGKAVVVHIKQNQDTADGTPIYSLPLVVGMLHSSGSTVERQSVTFDTGEHEFRFPAATRPDAVLIDPDHDLLKEVKDTHWAASELPVIARHAPCVVDRRAAIRLYCGLRGDAAPSFGRGGASENVDGAKLDDAKIEMLTEAVRAEQSESAAATILSILGTAKKEALRPLFREQAQSKQTGRRVAALEALSKLPGTPEDIQLFRKAALSDTEPYRVVTTAMNALAQYDATGNLDVLVHQVKVKSLRDQLARTAVNLASDIKTDAALPVFLDATGPIHSVSTRISAIAALGKATSTDTNVHAALCKQLTAGETPDIQAEAAHALKNRKDKEAVPLLRSVATSAKDKDVQTAAREAADAIEGK